MSITSIDPRTALILIDLQQGIVSLPVVHPADRVVAQCSKLMQAFHERNLPVVLVNVAGTAPGRTESPRRAEPLPTGWSDLVQTLPKQSSDHTVTKRTWGAFTGTDLQSYLQLHNITQVVVTGIATSIGVETTARQAFELGFHVTLATDAMTDTNLDAHQNSITRIFPRLGETGTTQEILDHLPV